MTTYEGTFNGAGLRFGIVVSRFNDLVTTRLLEGALDALTRHGVDPERIDIAWVPGAFELPLVAKRMAEMRVYDAILCLGAVIRGATSHFDYVAAEAAKGIATVSLGTGTPVLFGVLTTDTIEQAIERAGTKMGNKGFATAQAAIEMATLLRAIEGGMGNG